MIQMLHHAEQVDVDVIGLDHLLLLGSVALSIEDEALYRSNLDPP